MLRTALICVAALALGCPNVDDGGGGGEGEGEGEGATSGPCTGAADCAAGYACEESLGLIGLTCIHEECTADADCAAGACAATGCGHVCGAPAALGEVCDDFVEDDCSFHVSCAAGLDCVPSATADHRVCGHISAAGEPCFASGNCINGLDCDGLTSTCRESCDLADGSCPAGLACEPCAFTCAPPGDAGVVCFSVDVVDCAPGAFRACAAGLECGAAAAAGTFTCAAPGAAGAGCNPAVDAAQDGCDDGLACDPASSTCG